jgi:tetratricopeptide (TPR) repeat protein
MSQDKKKPGKREKHALSRKEASLHSPNKAATKSTLPVIYLLLVMAFGLALYGNTLKNGFVLDDVSAIYENFLVKQGTSALPEIFKTSYRYGYMSVNDGLYRPLSLALFSIEWEIFNNNPAPYHIINILLYTLGAIVVLFYTKRLMPEQPPALHLGTVLLFLSHPLHTEVVANVKSADELLCFLFTFLVLDLHLKYHEENKWFHLPLMGILCFLAFLAKESAVLILALVPLQAWLLYARGRTFKIRPLLPLLIVFFIILLIRKQVLGSAFGIQAVTMLDNPLFQENFLSRLLSGSMLMISYLRQLIFPHPLIFDYSYNSYPIIGTDQWEGYAAVTAWVVTLSLCMLAMRKKPLAGFIMLFFIGALLFYSNIPFSIGAMRAERFTFLSSLPFSLGLCYLVLRLPGSKPENMQVLPRGISLAVMTSLLLLFSFQTVKRNTDWYSNETLYRADMNKNAGNAKIRYYLGNELTKNKAEKTTDTLQRKAVIFEGIKYLRESVILFGNNSDAYTQIGVGYYKLKQYDSAAVNFNRALAINPGSNTALNNLGSVYFESQQYLKAVDIYSRVLSTDPNFVDSHVNLGSALGMLKRYPEAAESFKNALLLDPANLKALQFLAVTYDLMGQREEADKYRQRIKELQ